MSVFEFDIIHYTRLDTTDFQFLEGLTEAAKKIGARYPVTFYQNFEPQFPPDYKELADRLGLFGDE